MFRTYVCVANNGDIIHGTNRYNRNDEKISYRKYNIESCVDVIVCASKYKLSVLRLLFHSVARFKQILNFINKVEKQIILFCLFYSFKAKKINCTTAWRKNKSIFKYIHEDGKMQTKMCLQTVNWRWNRNYLKYENEMLVKRLSIRKFNRNYSKAIPISFYSQTFQMITSVQVFGLNKRWTAGSVSFDAWFCAC